MESSVQDAVNAIERSRDIIAVFVLQEFQRSTAARCRRAIRNEFYNGRHSVTSKKEPSCWLSTGTIAIRHKTLALAAIAACLALLHFLELPADTRFLRELVSTGHTLVFGLIALLVLALHQSRDSKAYLGAFIFTLTLGVISEFLQIFSLRDASLGDLVRDAIGAALFLSLAALWHRKNRRARSFVALGAVAVLSLSAGIAPLVLLARDYAGRDAAFPELCCFTGEWEQHFVQTDSVEVQRAAPPSREGEAGWMRLRFFPAKWPGVTIDEPYPDWSDYEALSFKIYSANPVSLALVLRVEDSDHNGDYYDRFNCNLNIGPGLNSFQLPISEIVDAPSNRPMSFRHMRRVLLFAAEPPRSFALYWNGFRLTKTKPETKLPCRN
jgi:VanZ family protein